jgi:hypothetical protein
MSCEGQFLSNQGINRAEAIDKLGIIISNAPVGISRNPGALQAHLTSLKEWEHEHANAAAQGGRQDAGQDQ